MILPLLGFGAGENNEEAASHVEENQRESGAAPTDGNLASTVAAVTANGPEHSNSAQPPAVMTNSTEGEIIFFTCVEGLP